MSRALFLTWIILSVGLGFQLFQAAEERTRMGIGGGVKTVVSPETASKIKEALETGACDPFLRCPPHPDSWCLGGSIIGIDIDPTVEDVCLQLRLNMQFERSLEIFEEPYTFKVFEKNQKYWNLHNSAENRKFILLEFAILSGALLLFLALVEGVIRMHI